MPDPNAFTMSRSWKRILLESLAIAAIGLVLALLANGVSPRGLSLTRDYFPGKTKPTVVRRPEVTAPETAKGPATPASATITSSASEELSARLREKGLQGIGGTEVRQLFDDPQYAQELIVFVDARDDHHYQEGHVPGAYQFDRYYPAKHLPAVLPVCLSALKVVVYCTGGNCEDSEFAALALKEVGVPPERLFVYTGGITEWSARGWPLESGGRKSGLIQGFKP